MAIDGRHQCNEAIGRKINVANFIPKPAENISKNQLDLLAARQQMMAIFARKGCKQSVFRWGVHRR